MNTLDHFFVLIFALVLPFLTYLEYRGVDREDMDNGTWRLNIYKKTLLHQWSLCFAALALWAFGGKAFSDLGLGWPAFSDTGFLASSAVVALIIFGLLYQNHAAKTASEEDLEKLKQSIAPVKFVLPHTQSELRWCSGLALTAGIVEEILWRGFLIAYLQSFLPLWAAITISVILFGLAHSYQGLRQLPGVMFAGALTAALFYFSGSLWLSILCHACIDLLQARLAYSVLKNHSDDTVVS